MKAQDCYDDRELLGFCSGMDLHKFFEKKLGEPSPSGYTDIDSVAWAQFVIECAQAMKQHSPSVFKHMSVDAEYKNVHATTRLAILHGLVLEFVIKDGGKYFSTDLKGNHIKYPPLTWNEVLECDPLIIILPENDADAFDLKDRLQLVWKQRVRGCWGTVYPATLAYSRSKEYVNVVKSGMPLVEMRTS